MSRFNSIHEQFHAGKSAANTAYLQKMRKPVEELLEYGFGYHALSSALNTKGYLTQRGKQFTRESARTLLKNLGLYTAGKERER